MYRVVAAPEVSDLLMEYAVKCAEDNGADCALRLADSFDKVIDSQQELPERGVKKLYRWKK